MLMRIVFILLIVLPTIGVLFWIYAEHRRRQAMGADAPPLIESLSWWVVGAVVAGTVATAGILVYLGVIDGNPAGSLAPPAVGDPTRE